MAISETNTTTVKQQVNPDFTKEDVTLKPFGKFDILKNLGDDAELKSIIAAFSDSDHMPAIAAKLEKHIGSLSDVEISKMMKIFGEVVAAAAVGKIDIEVTVSKVVEMLKLGGLNVSEILIAEEDSPTVALMANFFHSARASKEATVSLKDQCLNFFNSVANETHYAYRRRFG